MIDKGEVVNTSPFFIRKGVLDMILKPQQEMLIECIIANPSASLVKLAEMVGVNRNTVSAWKRNPEFRAALNRRMKEVWADSEAIAIKTMRDLATEKNFQASKYILDNLGYAPTTKIEAEVNSDINITIDE